MFASPRQTRRPQPEVVAVALQPAVQHQGRAAQQRHEAEAPPHRVLALRQPAGRAPRPGRGTARPAARPAATATTPPPKGATAAAAGTAGRSGSRAAALNRPSSSAAGRNVSRPGRIGNLRNAASASAPAPPGRRSAATTPPAPASGRASPGSRGRTSGGSKLVQRLTDCGGRYGSTGRGSMPPGSRAAPGRARRTGRTAPTAAWPPPRRRGARSAAPAGPAASARRPAAPPPATAPGTPPRRPAARTTSGEHASCVRPPFLGVLRGDGSDQFARAGADRGVQADLVPDLAAQPVRDAATSASGRVRSNRDRPRRRPRRTASAPGRRPASGGRPAHNGGSRRAAPAIRGHSRRASDRRMPVRTPQRRDS